MKELIKPNLPMTDYNLVIPDCDIATVGCGWYGCQCADSKFGDLEINEDLTF